MFLGGQMCIFLTFFNGRSYRFWMCPDILVGPWGVSWEVPWARGVSSGALGGSWGKRARDWSVPRGGLETELGMMPRYTISHIFPRIFYDFQKQHVFQRRAPGALMIFNDKYKTVFFRALGVPGALQERSARFFSAWGGPLGAAKACNMAKFD